MDSISVKLPAELTQRLADEARRRSVSKSTLVRDALERSLPARRDGSAQPSCTALAAELAGVVRSGRNDLGTNKRLLEEAIARDAGRRVRRRR